MGIPSQREVKSLLSDLVPHGKRKRIAAILGVSEGDICRRFNPEDERKLACAEALREQRAIASVDPRAFLALRTYIESVWDSWELKIGKGPDAGDVAKETADYVCAELQNRPLHIRRKELVEAGATIKRRISELSDSGLRKVG